jgi:hypothetical protein
VTGRVSGHKLTVQSSDDKTREMREAVGTCICGWAASAGSQREVRWSYHYHLRHVARAYEQERRQAVDILLQKQAIDTLLQRKDLSEEDT